MTVTVLMFARARDLAGTDRAEVDITAGATAADLRRRLAELYPALSGLLARSAVAVGDEFVGENQPIPPGARVALLPPVSGG